MGITNERIILEGALREALAAPASLSALAGAAGRVSRPDGRALRGSSENEMDVVALRSGTSKNGYFYAPAVVASLVPLLEGAQAYADHPGPQDRPERSVRDLVGFYRNARVEESQGSSGQPCEVRLVATLHLLESAEWLESMLREALEQQMPGLLGFSIDAQAQVEVRRDDASGQMVKAVTRFAALNSCDVVTKPSAGGRLLGLHRESAGAGQARNQQRGRQVMDEMTDLTGGYYYKEWEARNRQRIQETEGWDGSHQQMEPPASPEQLAALHADAQRALEAAQRAQRLAEC